MLSVAESSLLLLEVSDVRCNNDLACHTFRSHEKFCRRGFFQYDATDYSLKVIDCTMRSRYYY